MNDASSPVFMDGEPRHEEGEPTLVYRGRLMYWHHNPDAPPYETCDVTTQSMWTMLAAGMEEIMRKAPRDHEEVRGGFTPHMGGPGVISRR